MDHPHQYARELTDDEVGRGFHREFIGGYWDEIGALQFEFLIARGLKPESRLLDVGCGSLRGGIRFIEYLDAGGYYGIDMNESLIQAGRDIEIPSAGLSEKNAHLLVNSEFEVGDFGVSFDMALAQSVFSHLSGDWIRLCLEKVAPVMKPEASFYATYFRAEQPDGPVQQPLGGTISHPDKDPFHYPFAAFVDLADGLPFEVIDFGDWSHPRSQQMVEFRRR